MSDGTGSKTSYDYLISVLQHDVGLLVRHREGRDDVLLCIPCRGPERMIVEDRSK